MRPDTTTDRMRADGGMRLLRSAAFAAVCAAVSASAHAAASGAGVPWWSLLAGWAVTLCLAAPLAGRERSRPAIIAMLLCGQTVLHAVFCFGQSPAPSGPVMPGHHGMGAELMPGPGMFAVHLAAAFLLGWVLHRGEAAVWRLVRVSRRTAGALLAFVFVRRAVVRPPEARVRTRHRTDAETGRGETPLLDHAVVRRGPPVPAIA
ncbi:hypothetical protein [Actinomadura latina]|uniref:MFS transporter n=1 Tax=Actinomadura latina TaxID=163603 RepID=A0A846ZBG3_9ACTN|nr:hypothetical protein [Actinomadura latina]NKZ07845.1 hypothetical protein [Actinomadura latina]